MADSNISTDLTKTENSVATGQHIYKNIDQFRRGTAHLKNHSRSQKFQLQKLKK